MIRTSIALALALAAAGCAVHPPRADRIVYVTEYVELEEPAAQRGPQAAWTEPQRGPLRDDVPESVRREWYANNGPQAYVPAREAADEGGDVVHERPVYVDRGCGGCGGYGGFLGLPIALSLGYFGHDHGHGHDHGGWGYGIGIGNGFGCW